MKNKQFTCPVSMAVTEEQFNNDLKQPLIDLGYKECQLSDNWIKSYILCNNFLDNLGNVSNIEDATKLEFSRYFIAHYNPKLFLALASLTNESTETKEEVLARFENKIEEMELIGYRFKNDDFNNISFKALNHRIGKHPLIGKKHLQINSPVYKYLDNLNLLETFCEPVYKEIKTISIEEAESILRSIGRTEKIKA